MKTKLLVNAFVLPRLVQASLPVVAGRTRHQRKCESCLEYVFRGQSQTRGRGCAGRTRSRILRLYIGARFNVDFNSDATAEIDYYGGYVFCITDDLSLDIGYIRYSYAGESDLDYDEVKAALGWKDLTVGVNYSWNYLGEDPFGDGDVDFFYYFADYSFALPADFSLGLHVALNQADGDVNNIAFESRGENEYTEWNASLGKSFLGADFALTYWGTSIDGSNELGDERRCSRYRKHGSRLP
jgi:uncharacterized protein (TIGR02001 family)